MNIRSTSTRRSAGFTLIEMLVVFVIIAILIGILVPVISGAFRSAKQAAEVVEINSLVTALQQFKDRFGHYPPSQMILKEDGDYIVGAGYFVPAAPQDNAVFFEELSVQYLRYYWPELVIHTRTGGPANPVTPLEIGDINGDGAVNASDFYDWNGDNVKNGPWFLQGDECLVFFLGGIQSGQFLDSSGATLRPSGVGLNPKTYPAGTLGFGKNSRWPMKQPVAGSASAGRDGPFYEFDSGRLVDRDTDGFWEFLPLRKPERIGGYAYFSGYDGTGYRPDDLNFGTEFDSLITIPSVGLIEFRVNWQVPSTYPAAFIGVEPVPTPQTSVRSPGPNPYTIGPPMIDTVKTPRYWKPEAFQIISPGSDNHYGQGGAIERLGPGSTTPRAAPNGAYEEARADDDNLVSFAGSAVKDVSSK